MGSIIGFSPLANGVVFDTLQINIIIAFCVSVLVFAVAIVAILILKHYKSSQESLQESTESECGVEAVGKKMEALIKAAQLSKCSKTVITKANIADYCRKKFGSDVEIQEHNNYSANKLPLSDNYFLKKAVKLDRTVGNICFAYIYELDNQSMFLIVRTDAKTAKTIKEKHPQISHSHFPKYGNWYSIVIDDTFDSEADIINLIEIVLTNRQRLIQNDTINHSNLKNNLQSV